MILRALALITLLGSFAQASFSQRLTLVAAPSSPVQARYLEFLHQHLADNGVLTTTVEKQGKTSADEVVVGTQEQMHSLLAPAAFHAWKSRPHSSAPEGYDVLQLRQGVRTVLILSAANERGELFAMGWLLRSAERVSGTLHLPQTEAFSTQPDRNVRGYQIGYRMKNNTYDAWTLEQFRQQMLDLAVFGLNTLQAVAPISDDDSTSPLFPAPAESTVIGLSQMSKDYGLRFDLFYPEMAKDYTDPVQAHRELRQYEDLIRKLPLVDSIHIPGGDPGHTAPEVLLPLIEQEAAILHRYHPRAQVWISAQGFTAERYDRFFKLLQDHPAYLTGVFFGPQSRQSMQQQRASIPVTYPVEFYPDTAHAMHSQFPVPQWDPVYALTEGREPIDPRPAGFEYIYKHFYAYDNGFIVYSEGVNDDINKVLWGELGWNAQRSSHAVLQDYSRYFFHSTPVETEQVAQGIEQLEQNWSGPLLQNLGIAPTLAALRQLHPSNAMRNWRWDSLLYRASYDRYVQVKRARELTAEDAALAMLSDDAAAAGARIAQARVKLRGSEPEREETDLHQALSTFAAALFHECGLQLSVPLYGASNWERGANFDRVDTPLNDRTWIEARLREAEALSGREQALSLNEIAHWSKPTMDALYDNLGDPAAEPHLVRGSGWQNDPELYHTAIDGIADQTLQDGWRFSWLDYAETLYEQPLQLHYSNLKSGSAYTLRITYAGEDYKLPMELTANGTVLHRYRLRKSNPEQIELSIPSDLIQTGELTLKWQREYGAGGGGRGGQVAEVWLWPSL